VTQRITVDNEYILIFTGDHPAIITGSLRARITNDSTGKGIDVSVSLPNSAQDLCPVLAAL
jgi:hypothetical protein